jgi:uncharacterized protein YdaU (DUF1376 family)
MSTRDYIGKAPAYQCWDEKAFSFDTLHLHWQAKLLYRALLQAAWHLSTRPDLPANDAQLQNILGVPAEVWTEHKTAVRAMFILDAATNVLWQKRLRADWVRFEGIRKTRSEIGRKGGLARASADAHDDIEQSESKSKAKAEQLLGNSIARKEEKREVKQTELPSHPIAPSGTELQKPAALGRGSIAASVGSPVEAPADERRGSPSAPPKSPMEPHVEENTKVNGNTQGIGQEESDAGVEHLRSIAIELGWQIPMRRDVQVMLGSYSIREIESAMREYDTENSNGVTFAEKLFFADGGGSSVILAQRRRAVEVKS